MSYESHLREAADTFVLAVIVIAEEQGRTANELAEEAIADSLARLSESGAIGPDYGEEERP